MKLRENILGTVGAAYTVGVASTIVSGDYNIVGDTIFFTTPPYGKIGPVGLETGSTFNGRHLVEDLIQIRLKIRM